MTAADPGPARGSAASELARLADEAWETVLADQPLLATSIGDRRYDDRLADPRPEARAAQRQRLGRLAERCRAIPADALEPADGVTRLALIAFLEAELDVAIADVARWALDPLDGPQVQLLNLSSYQAVDRPADGDRLIERWRAMAPYVDRQAANLITALDDGLVSPEAPVRAVIDELDDLLDGRDGAEALLAPGAADRPDWPGPDRDRFAAELERVVRAEVLPAFARYRAVVVERVLPSARSNDRPGLAELPGGDEAYRRLVRAHTSLALGPGEIHAIGLAEVERIDAELADRAGSVLGTADGAAARSRLRDDPAVHFTTSAEVFATATAALDRATAALPDWFGTLPRAACEVVEMGAHEAKHSTIAYYLQPAEDGSRPGRYYLNTTAPETRPRYEAEALAFHESIPGHHLQLARGQELTGLPGFRRHAGSTAFFEGWGLYTERLSEEMGLYSGELDRIGIASFDGWRACRLVVDTGMHALGWTRDRAIAYMLEHTALAPDNVVNEVDRYITWPGQALAYKLGQLEIRRLRDETASRLGGRFDVRAFHDTVLGDGALPLPVLRAVVERTFPAG